MALWAHASFAVTKRRVTYAMDELVRRPNAISFPSQLLRSSSYRNTADVRWIDHPPKRVGLRTNPSSCGFVSSFRNHFTSETMSWSAGSGFGFGLVWGGGWGVNPTHIRRNRRDRTSLKKVARSVCGSSSSKPGGQFHYATLRHSTFSLRLRVELVEAWPRRVVWRGQVFRLSGRTTPGHGEWCGGRSSAVEAWPRRTRVAVVVAAQGPAARCS